MQEADLTDRRLALYSAGAGEPSEPALLPLATAFVPRDKISTAAGASEEEDEDEVDEEEEGDEGDEEAGPA